MKAKSSMFLSKMKTKRRNKLAEQLGVLACIYFTYDQPVKWIKLLKTIVPMEWQITHQMYITKNYNNYYYYYYITLS